MNARLAVVLLASITISAISVVAQQIFLSARVPARAKLSGDSPVSGQIHVSRTGPDHLLIEAPARLRSEVPFSFVMNTRNARIRVGSTVASDSLVDISPSSTTCDWIHTQSPIRGNRVAALVSHCEPSQRQAGVVLVEGGSTGVMLTISLEPVEHEF